MPQSFSTDYVTIEPRMENLNQKGERCGILSKLLTEKMA